MFSHITHTLFPTTIWGKWGTAQYAKKRALVSQKSERVGGQH